MYSDICLHLALHSPEILAVSGIHGAHAQPWRPHSLSCAKCLLFVGDNWLGLKFNPLSWMEAQYVQTWCVLNGCRNTSFLWHCVCLAALARYAKKVHGSCAGIQMREGERRRKRLFIWKIAHISKNNGTESVHIALGGFIMFFFDHFLLMGDPMLPSSHFGRK